MSRRLRRDLNRRVSSAGYEKITGDLEVTGSFIGPSIQNLVAAVQQLTARTTDPVKIDIFRCEGTFKGIVVQWFAQYNLVTFDRYEIQVSDDEISWYSLAFDGTDWKHTLDADTDWQGPLLVHIPIPFGGTVEAPTAVTLSYRIRQATADGTRGPWSDAASATTSLIQTSDIVADAITANKILANAVTADKILANAVTADKIATNAVTAGKIAAGSIATDRLTVVATSFINNVTHSEGTNGWGLKDEFGVGDHEYLGYDGTDKALTITNPSGVDSVGIRSQSFPIDNNKVYIVRFELKKSAAGGQVYVGLSAYTEATAGAEGTGTAVGTENVTGYTAARAVIDTNTNSYWYFVAAGNSPTGWVTGQVWIIGANRDIKDPANHEQPAGTATHRPFAKLSSGVRHCAIRILNWNNAGTSRVVSVRNISVIEANSGKIVADNIDVTNLAAIKADIGTITAGILRSSDWGTGAGMEIDLGAKRIRMTGSSAPTIDIQAGSSSDNKITTVSGNFTSRLFGGVLYFKHASHAASGGISGLASGGVSVYTGEPISGGMSWYTMGSFTPGEITLQTYGVDGTTTKYLAYLKIIRDASESYLSCVGVSPYLYFPTKILTDCYTWGLGANSDYNTLRYCYKDSGGSRRFVSYAAGSWP